MGGDLKKKKQQEIARSHLDKKERTEFKKKRHTNFVMCI